MPKQNVRTMDFVRDAVELIHHIPETQYIVVAMMPNGIPIIHQNLSNQSKKDWENMRGSLVPLFADQNLKHIS